MKLTYRGVSYNQPDQPVTTTSGAVMGKYRGTAWVARIVTSALKPAPVQTLCWRGVAYNTDGSPVEVAPVAASVVPSPAKVQRPSENLADAHRHWIIKSLEHRLEVARSRGDQGLVQLLEDEWKQFA